MSVYIVKVSGEFVVDDEEICHNTTAEAVLRDKLNSKYASRLDIEARLAPTVEGDN